MYPLQHSLLQYSLDLHSWGASSLWKLKLCPQYMEAPNYSPELGCQKLAICAGSIQSCSPLSGTILGLMSLMFLSVVRVLSIDCFLLLHTSQSRMRQNVLQLSNFRTCPGRVWYELHQRRKCPFCWGITVVSNLDWSDNLAWIFFAGDISHRNCDTDIFTLGKTNYHTSSMAQKQIVITWKMTQSECGRRKGTSPKSKVQEIQTTYRLLYGWCI